LPSGECRMERGVSHDQRPVATAPHVHVIQTRSPSTPPSRLKENLVLCLECYAGKPGAPFGVKLKDQVLVTAEEARLIYTYPYNAKLLD
jgi:hypothetical protein